MEHHGGVPRVVLLIPTATYRAEDFVAAAGALGAEVVVASERRQALADTMGDRSIVVPFDRPDVAAARIVAAARRHPVDAVVGVDEAGVVPAALAAARLGLPHNPPDAVATTRDKAALRERLTLAGVRQPRFAVAQPADDVGALAREVGLPCVVKAVGLSASRGVLRADTPEAAVAAAARIREVLATADAGAERGGDVRPDPEGPLLVESYVPGDEVAVEGLLERGRLRVLAVFDKPEPMEGPVFTETMLVTPSRGRPPGVPRGEATAAAAAAAVGLVEGPVHAELRVHDGDATVLELAARTIGGLCSRTLRFGTGLSLEEVVLRHALGLPLGDIARDRGAAGVVMLPVPRAGTFREVTGRDDALAVAGIEALDVTVSPGSEVRPLPDASRYVGFLFARAGSADAVEVALRAAWSRIGIVVDDPHPDDGG
jgi:biotin carboxylase